MNLNAAKGAGALPCLALHLIAERVEGVNYWHSAAFSTSPAPAGRRKTACAEHAESPFGGGVDSPTPLWSPNQLRVRQRQRSGEGGAPHPPHPGPPGALVLPPLQVIIHVLLVAR